MNLQHVLAPSFFGADEIVHNLAKRSYTATCTTPDTMVMMAPATIFRALVLSANAVRAYDTSAKLAASLEARRKWYVTGDLARTQQ